MVHCPACSSYLRPPRSWIYAAPDSAELMQILIRRVDCHTACHGVPTEPPHSNSKRLALRVRLRRETTHGMMVEEDHVAEFAVHDRLYDAYGMALAWATGPDQQCVSPQDHRHG